MQIKKGMTVLINNNLLKTNSRFGINDVMRAMKNKAFIVNNVSDNGTRIEIKSPEKNLKYKYTFYFEDVTVINLIKTPKLKSNINHITFDLERLEKV